VSLVHARRVSSPQRPVTFASLSTMGAACLGVAALVTARAAYADASARLVYARAPEASSCPDEGALRSAVSARLGYDPFFPWAKQTVVVQVWRESRQYKARLQLIDAAGLAHGTRALSSSQTSCAELFDAAALAISIAMDSLPKEEPAPATTRDAASPPTAPPSGSASAHDDAAASTPAPAPPPPHIETAAPAAAPSPPPPALLGLDLGVDVLGVAGVEPGLTVGAAAFVGLRTRGAYATIEVRGDAPASAASAATVGRVHAWSLQAALVPCARYLQASFCAVGVLGQLRAESTGITDPRADEALFVSAGARVGVDWPLSERLSLRTHVDATVDLRRVHLQIGGGEAWTAPLVGGVAGAGLVAHFR
jgi:hypothetical protein